MVRSEPVPVTILFAAVAPASSFLTVRPKPLVFVRISTLVLVGAMERKALGAVMPVSLVPILVGARSISATSKRHGPKQAL